jgi:hypothetical protein
VVERPVRFFTDFTTGVVEAQDFGDVTLAVLRQRARGAGSDAPTEQSIWNVARWRWGKCIWWRAFDSRDEALEAIGLSEQDVSNA